MRTAFTAGAIALVCLASAGTAHANPAIYVATPQIEEGERDIEIVQGFERARDGGSATGTALKLGYSPTSWWALEAALLWHREPGERFGYDAWEVETRFALTETGEYPVDVALLVEVEHPKDRSEGWELRWGPLLQMQSGALQANLNLLLARRLRSEAPARTEFGYEWQLRWRTSPSLDWGAQGFGSTGPWRDWNARSGQAHRLGPALFGKLRTGGGSAVRYDAALLFGTGGEAPRRALRARAEFEF